MCRTLVDQCTDIVRVHSFDVVHGRHEVRHETAAVLARCSSQVRSLRFDASRELAPQSRTVPAVHAVVLTVVSNHRKNRHLHIIMQPILLNGFVPAEAR